MIVTILPFQRSMVQEYQEARENFVESGCKMLAFFGTKNAQIVVVVRIVPVFFILKVQDAVYKRLK
jgi:hypothetical protein